MRLYTRYTDTKLLALLGQGDERAFSTLYQRYWKKLFVIASNRLDHPEDAEEIVQDIFASLWRRRAVLKHDLDFPTYLAVSVKYRVIKMMGKHYLQTQYVDSLAARDWIDGSAQESLAFDELRERLAIYVAPLPERCRLVSQLNRHKGFSQKQIASELSISEKT